MKFHLLPFIILINLLFPDEINYSTMIFGTKDKKVIKNIEIIEMKNNRLYYFHLDNFRRRYIGCSVIDTIKLITTNESELYYYPSDCNRNKIIDRNRMLIVSINKINKLTISTQNKSLQNPRTDLKYTPPTKYSKYKSLKKSPIKGVLYSSLIPSLGHVYAGNPRKGLIFASAQLISTLSAFFSLKKAIENGTCPKGEKGDLFCSEKKDSYFFLPFPPFIFTFISYEYSKIELDSFYKNLAIISVIASTTVSIWERVDVYKEVKKYNRRVYKDIFGKEPPSFSLNLQPTYQGANLTLAYKFD